MKIPELIEQAKLVICYPAKDGLALRKEPQDITQEELDIQWGLLNKIQKEVKDEN